MDDAGIVLLLSAIVVLYIWRFIQVKKLLDYYDAVYTKVLEVSKKMSSKDTECVYTIMTYIRNCRSDRTIKREFQRGVRKKLNSYEKDNKVTKETARLICQAINQDS